MKYAKPLSAILTLFSLLLALSIPRSVVHAGDLAQVPSPQQPGTRQNLSIDQIIVKYKSATGLNLATATNQAAPMAALSGAAGVSLSYYRAMSDEAHVLKLPSN